MIKIEYKGIETNKSDNLISEWVLIEFPELEAFKFYKIEESINIKTLLLFQIKNNEFFVYSTNEIDVICYDYCLIEDREHKKVIIERFNETIIFRSNEGMIEFNRK